MPRLRFLRLHRRLWLVLAVDDSTDRLMAYALGPSRALARREALAP